MLNLNWRIYLKWIPNDEGSGWSREGRWFRSRVRISSNSSRRRSQVRLSLFMFFLFMGTFAYFNHTFCERDKKLLAIPWLSQIRRFWEFKVFGKFTFIITMSMHVEFRFWKSLYRMECIIADWRQRIGRHHMPLSLWWSFRDLPSWLRRYTLFRFVCIYTSLLFYNSTLKKWIFSQYLLFLFNELTILRRVSSLCTQWPCSRRSSMSSRMRLVRRSKALLISSGSHLFFFSIIIQFRSGLINK